MELVGHEHNDDGVCDPYCGESNTIAQPDQQGHQEDGEDELGADVGGWPMGTDIFLAAVQHGTVVIDCALHLLYTAGLLGHHTPMLSII